MTHNLIAETISITGHDDDEIEAYLARPTDVDKVGSMVVIHHLPGYDEATKEICRNFAAHGYNALMPNLYWREVPTTPRPRPEPTAAYLTNVWWVTSTAP
jgi:carboxymethylenebutenolidase